MAISSTTTVSWSRIRAWILTLTGVLMCGLSSGCVTLWPWTRHSEPGLPPCQLVVHWHNEVGFAPDAAQDGKPVAGFAGRMYLLGPEVGIPLKADGTLTVTLYDPFTKDAEGNPTAMQNWILPAGQLATVEKTDIFGRGYTLFLPWAMYHPQIAAVQLRAKYTPKNGVPLFFDSGILKLGALKVLEAPTIKKGQRVGQPHSDPVASPGNQPKPRAAERLPMPRKVNKPSRGVPIYPQLKR